MRDRTLLLVGGLVVVGVVLSVVGALVEEGPVYARDLVPPLFGVPSLGSLLLAREQRRRGVRDPELRAAGRVLLGLAVVLSVGALYTTFEAPRRPVLDRAQCDTLRAAQQDGALPVPRRLARACDLD